MCTQFANKINFLSHKEPWSLELFLSAHATSNSIYTMRLSMLPQQEKARIKLVIRIEQANPMEKKKITALDLGTYLAFYFLNYDNYLHLRSFLSSSTGTPLKGKEQGNQRMKEEKHEERCLTGRHQRPLRWPLLAQEMNVRWRIRKEMIFQYTNRKT